MLKRSAIGAVLACALALAGCGSHSKTSPNPSKHLEVSQSATGSVHPPGWGSTPKGIALPAPLLGGTTGTATMYDAVTLSNIPPNPFAVAGYIAGNWPTWFRLAGDFPGAHHVSIAIHLGQHAMCGDFEPRDMASSQAGQFALDDIRAGFSTPCAYGDLSNMPAIQASLRAALGPNWRSHVLLWLAWYRGIPGLVQGYDAVQYDDHCLGRGLDCNTVTLNFLRIAQPPYVPTPVNPVCFSHRIPAKTCAAVKAKIASQQRAATSSQRAYIARGCPGIASRRSWFAAHVNRPPASKHAYRARALAASRAAYRRESCGVFAQRSSYFTAAAAKLRAAN